MRTIFKDGKMSLDDLDHPCKQTCSGWQQGYEAGKRENQLKLNIMAAALTEMRNIKLQSVDHIYLLQLCEWFKFFAAKVMDEIK